MPLRPGRCYKRTHRPYTRVSISVPRRSYVVGVPASKITQFEMGNRKKQFEKQLDLISLQECQVRHNALEAARQAVNKYMDKKVTSENYFFKVLVFPHHVLRENSLATGAGADRFQEGMRKNFGKPIGTAAQVSKKQAVFRISVNAKDISVAKEAFRRAATKLPMLHRVVEK